MHLNKLSATISCRDELVNGLSGLLDRDKVKPSEVLAFTNLFSEATCRDGVSLLIRV